MGDTPEEKEQAEQKEPLQKETPEEKKPLQQKESTGEQKQAEQKEPPGEQKQQNQKEKNEEKKHEEQKKGAESKFNGKINDSPITDSDVVLGNENTINKIINNISKSDYELSDFSLNDDSLPLSKQSLILVEDFFVYPPGQLNELIGFLKEHHVLLLTGEADSGKYLTAKYLCTHIMQERKKEYDVRFIDSLDSKKQIELSRLINNKIELEGKMLIFKDVFALKNKDIIRFIESCSKEPVFKELETFIIFTADRGTFDNYRIDGLKIARNIFQLDNDLLRKGFDLKLKHFCSLSPKRELMKISQQFEAQKDEIIEQLKTMSNISRFIENFLDGIVFEGKPLSEAIDEVLSIRKRLEHWFLKELGMNENDFETWTFSLCLAIFKNIPYTMFNAIHRDITMILLAKLDPFKTLKGFTFTLSESELLEKCEAQIDRHPETLADHITFKEQDYHTELLKILLKNNRRVLLTISPYLEKYIESHYYYDQRRLVAIGLARIGRLAPQTIMRPIIGKWANLKDDQWQNVGYLYEGIFNSDDNDYRNYCLGILNAMAFSDDISEKWTAITAYKQIGLHNPEFAIDEFRKIQENTLVRMREKEGEKTRDFIYSKISGEDGQDVLESLDEIYKETNVIFYYIQFSIAALAISIFEDPIGLDPIDVLDGLKQWIHKGNRNSRANVVLIFMGDEGILKRLAERDVTFLDEDQEGKKEKSRTNLLLYALSSGEAQVKKMTAFLIDLYNKCFPEFGVEVKKVLKKQLFHHLEKWIIDNLSSSRIINAIEELIVQLYNSGNEELKDTLWDNINRWKAPGKKEKELDAFIDKVSKRIFNM